MDTQIVIVYCICEDILKAICHYEDPQCQMSDAEVLTTAIVAMQWFGGNFERARALLKQPQYIPKMLSKSRFNRRLHRIQHLVQTLFAFLGELWKEYNIDKRYIIDTFPVAVCDNYRIPRARIYQNEAYRGYISSKKRYFYGLKIHLLVTEAGQPVEFFLTPASYSDGGGLRRFEFDLPSGSTVYADKAYTNYLIEDLLEEARDIHLSPFRKKNSLRPVPPWVHYLQHTYRKMIETAGSLINGLFPKCIHAVTANGFELKVGLFLLAYSFNCL